MLGGDLLTLFSRRAVPAAEEAHGDVMLCPLRMWWAAEGDRRGRISQQGDPPTLKDVFALTTRMASNGPRGECICYWN
jgi:hypothetical protein